MAKPSAQEGPSVDGSAYDIIRARLVEQGAALDQGLAALNARRLAVFGGQEMAVLANERVRTEHACVPVDLVPLHFQDRARLLLGVNAFLGLKKDVQVGDVFSLHRCEKKPHAEGGHAYDLDALPADAPEQAFLQDERFVKDFTELYRYYKDAKLVALRREAGKLLAVFQIGLAAADVKVLRWVVGDDGHPKYVDNRGDQDLKPAPQFSFEWTRTSRDDHVVGKHPHVSILDQVFVEAIAGDLTIKIEDNTATGQGVYSESVEDRNQSLDDAQISYAKVGALILLKILPYRETTPRHLVFHTTTKEVRRIDQIGESCVELPEGHGVIFPGGYALSTGEIKTFDMDVAGLQYAATIKSPNGEDVLYAFHQRERDRSVLFAYNLIAKEVATPVACNGWCVFDDGTMTVFRADTEEAARVHPIRLWRTPFTSAEHAARADVGGEHAGTLLARVGNAEAVRAISDAGTVKRMIANQSPTMGVYEELIAQATRVLDAYPWLAEKEAGALASTIADVKTTAELVIDEFEKVLAIQKTAAEALAAAQERQRGVMGEIRPDSWTSIDPFVEAMAKLRLQRGRLVTLKEQRYVDLAAVAKLEEEATQAFDALVERAGAFLAQDGALQPYVDKHDALLAASEQAQQAADTAPLLEQLEALSTQLSLLTEIVGTLKIQDANARTKILEDIASVFGALNRGRALVVDKRKALLAQEGASEFAAQFKLYAQAVESALGLCDTPERTDDQLSRLLVQLEELEGRFAEFDAFLPELAKKREEVFEAFTARKQRLLDERQRRCANLGDSAKRILEGVKRRALQVKDLDALNALFAGDPMVEKARTIADELRALGDVVRGEEIVALLKAARDESTRQLRDKSELFVDGADLLSLGKHRFFVNTQPFDLTVLPRGDHLALHLTGTDFFETIDDPELTGAQDLWESTLPSEDATVYRGETLATSILRKAERGVDGLSVAALAQAALDGDELDDLVRKEALARYDEGYERGVHDADATAILRALLTLRRAAGTLSHAPSARALASIFWAYLDDADERAVLAAKARATARLVGVFPTSARRRAAAAELGAAIARFAGARGLVVDDAGATAAGASLLDELAVDAPKFPLSVEGRRVLEDLHGLLDREGKRAALRDDLKALGGRLGDVVALATAWVDAFVADKDRASAPEVAAALVTDGRLERDRTGAATSIVVDGLYGQHPRIVERKLDVRLDELLPRVETFLDVRVPRYRRFQQRRAEVIEAARKRLRIDEYKPRVLSSFVRNKLIQDVYLPIVGDNLAKQMGAAGDKKRSDLMGLLLLVSPPGYGKTTLVEYIASRLGLVFVKANGPALGHDVTSLDPSEAPNATARQEVEKINFALELGQNVMLLIDDIQHCSPELLQKFISLCDGTRRIEGVWKGKTRTYDLRGKKFCVVMAGNPYTESGEKFKVPDMLANRADTYNLGDILGGKQEQFSLSFVENALTSNQVLQPLAGREMGDVYKLVRMAQGEDVPTTDLKHGYSGAELDEVLRVLKKVLRARDTLLKVNAEYIASASQDDRYRTEPPFKLQGSYRNMAKVTEKIVGVMNDDELERVLDDHYRSESQTLTTGAEQNLLKLAELRNRMTAEQKARWDEIKKGFGRAKLLGGREDDPVARVTATLSGVAERVEGIGEALRAQTGTAPVVSALAALREAVTSTNHGAAVAGELAALRAAVTAAAARPAPDPGPVVEHAAAAIAKELAALKKAVADAAKATGARDANTAAPFLQRVDQAIEALGKAHVDVHVQAPPPQGVNDLLRLQTILIEASLLPLVKGMASSIEHERGNAARLEEALEALRALEQRGVTTATATASTPMYRPFAPKGTRSEDK